VVEINNCRSKCQYAEAHNPTKAQLKGVLTWAALDQAISTSDSVWLRKCETAGIVTNVILTQSDLHERIFIVTIRKSALPFAALLSGTGLILG
jgi:hypothetical protein